MVGADTVTELGRYYKIQVGNVCQNLVEVHMNAVVVVVHTLHRQSSM